MRQRIATALEAVGAVLLVAAGFMVAPAAGVGVVGVGLVAFGIAVERDG